MANWFSKMLISSALVSSLNAQQAQSAETNSQDPKTNPVEMSTGNQQASNQGIRIFKHMTNIDMDTPLPRSWSGGGHNQEIKAYYDHSHKRVVCLNYAISDEVAYLRAKHLSMENNTSRPPREDFKTALSEFNQMLKTVKYNGELPKNLDDVTKLLSSADLGLKEKNHQAVRRSASETGLEAASDLKQSIENINEQNTARGVITHEIEHSETAPIKEKALFPSSLLSPQDYLLFTMADEINSFTKEGELEGKTPEEVIQTFRSVHEGSYLERNAQKIDAENSYWNSETYRHSYAQNMDLEGAYKVTKRDPIVFDHSQNLSVTIDGQKYDALKCLRESDNSWCYSVMEDGERKQLPEGTILTAANGKKYEANVMYDGKTGKPLLDDQGHKTRGMGFWDEDNSSWSLKLSSYELQPKDNFSTKNLDKLMTEKFGEKSADNQLRNLIEAEFERYRQTDSYKRLSSIYTADTMNADYISEAKQTPVSDDYVKQGNQYRAEQYNDTKDMIDITDRFTKQGIAASHINYIRSAKLGQNKGRDASAQNLQSANQQSGTTHDNFVETYNKVQKQR